MATTLYTHTIATLAEVKTWLGIPNNDHNDLLNFLMNATTDWFESHCRRRMVKRADWITEYFDGDGDYEYFVNYPPIDSIDEILIEDVITLDSTDCADTDQVRYDTDPMMGRITLVVYRFTEFRSRNCYVKYKGGWAVADVPMQIKQAFRHELKRLWGLKKTSHEDVTQKGNRLSGENTSYTPAYLRKGLSGDVKAALEAFVLRRF